MLEDYKDNQFWLMKGDCLERMKEIPSGSVDMVLADKKKKVVEWDNLKLNIKEYFI